MEGPWEGTIYIQKFNQSGERRIHLHAYRRHSYLYYLRLHTDQALRQSSTDRSYRLKRRELQSGTIQTYIINDHDLKQNQSRPEQVHRQLCDMQWSAEMTVWSFKQQSHGPLACFICMMAGRFAWPALQWPHTCPWRLHGWFYVSHINLHSSSTQCSAVHQPHSTASPSGCMAALFF